MKLQYSIVLAIALFVCTLPANAYADGKPRRFEITPLFGFVAGGTFEDKFTSQEIKLRNSRVVGLQLNIRADSQSTWEIQYARQETQASTPSVSSIDVLVEKLEFGGTYETISESTRPFVAATLGVSRFKPQSNVFEDDTYLSFSIGGGVKFFADRQLGITVDARWIAAVIDEDTDVFCLSADGLMCLIQADAGLASQFRVFVGIDARF